MATGTQSSALEGPKRRLGESAQIGVTFNVCRDLEVCSCCDP